MRKLLFFLLVTLCLAFANAYKYYQDKIPNGELVPHPCKPNYLWKGVGHLNVLGGGDRNPFGEDFVKFGEKWSKEFCEMDSDGDGKTNGQELGDPGCVWTPDGGAPSATASGHPGVCEPVDSENCTVLNAAVRDNWDFCQQGEFKCDGIKEPDVMNFTIAIDKGTLVPAEETTYMCQMMKLPLNDDRKYHIIGTKPTIDNPYVAHHIIVYGCDEQTIDTISHYASPQVCDAMTVQSACSHLVGFWTLGMDGYCEIPHVGNRFGKKLYTYAMIEIHWNNPTKVTNYVDGSGLTVFYTPNLRKYDGGTLTLGQLSLAIPPDADAHYQSSLCTSDCTKTLKEPMYLYTVNFHMHYLGRGGRLEQWRNGSLLRILSDDKTYSYDNPLFHPIDPPAKLEPGDELKSFCKFKSNARNEVTYFGEGTSDEMCLITLFTYPRNAFRACVAYGAMDVCFSEGDLSDWEAYVKDQLLTMDCDEASYDPMIRQLAEKAEKLCGDPENAVCTWECRDLFLRAYQEEKCLRNGLRFYFESIMRFFKAKDADKLVKLLRVCDKEILTVNSKLQYYDKAALMASGADMTAPGFVMVLFTAVYVLMKGN